MIEEIRFWQCFSIGRVCFFYNLPHGTKLSIDFPQETKQLFSLDIFAILLFFSTGSSICA